MPKAQTKAAPISVFVNDPIFGAIEDHQKLDRKWLEIERSLEAGVQGATERDIARASAAAENAAWRMAHTKPTTTAGAAALLAYITTGPITGLFELGETAWHETAFRTAVQALDDISGGPRRVA